MRKNTGVSNRLAEINFRKQYDSGERRFNRAELNNVDLSNRILAELELGQANINYSTFEKTTLNDSNLSESSLICTNFKKSAIDNVMFNRANLEGSKLSLSKITDTSFFGACLYKASFCGAKINNLDFSYANLSAAYLAGIDLSTSIFEGAVYSFGTAFPSEFDPEEAGMIHEANMFDLERLTVKFDRLYQQAKMHLGDTITAKYLNSSRPEHDGLDKLETDKNSKIVFNGDAIKSLNHVEAEYLRQWMIVFASLCCKIVRNVGDDEELFSSGFFS